MKRLFIILFLFALSACANDDKSHNDNINSYPSAPLVSENSLVPGANRINYDVNKSLNTLIYYAQSPAVDDYELNNSYSISGNGQQVPDTDVVSQKIITKTKGIKEIIKDKNKRLQEYTYLNNIRPINEAGNISKKTMPVDIQAGTKWDNVYVLDVETGTFNTIDATCIAVSQYAYFFLRDGLTPPSDEQIREITNAFDKDYEIIHKYYGKEEDTDGNGKVSFLIADFSPNIMGFFYSADKFKQQDLPDEEKSNEADVLYVNHHYFEKSRWDINKTDVLATFIHEFQHMTLFDSRSRLNLNSYVSAWINEGLSMLAEYYGGYTSPHYRYIGAYFDSEQGISLITDDSSQNYGLSYLFARYLQIRFGDSFIQTIYTSPDNGIKIIEAATGLDFNTLFLDFVKMILVTGRGVTDDPVYNIEEFNYPAGTDGYTRNGFNLASIIDEVYNSGNADNTFITSAGYGDKQLGMYGFFITKWKGVFDTIELTGNNGIAGFYYAW